MQDVIVALVLYRGQSPTHAEACRFCAWLSRPLGVAFTRAYTRACTNAEYRFFVIKDNVAELSTNTVFNMPLLVLDAVHVTSPDL